MAVEVGKKKRTRPKREVVERPSLSIPDVDDLTEIPDSVTDFLMVLYGESAIGKTSVVSQAPGAYIIQCDRRRKGLRVRQSQIESLTIADLNANKYSSTPWEDIRGLVKEAASNDTVETLIIDNFRAFYEHAQNHVCFREGIENPGEMNDFGATWAKVTNEVVDCLNSYAESEKGLIILCHAKIKEVETIEDSEKQERVQPDLQSGAMRFIADTADFVFYLGRQDNERAIVIRNTDDNTHIWTKCCIQETNGEYENFKDPDGKPLYTIPMGKNASQAWQNLNAAFNNTIRDINYRPEKNSTAKEKIRKKKVKGDE